MKTTRSNANRLSVTGFLFLSQCFLLTTLANAASDSQTIGLLTCGEKQCTAALVGPMHLLTAGHCLPDDKQKLNACLYSTQFENGNFQLNVPVSAHYWRGGGNAVDDQFLGTDWAILMLDRKLGNEMGFMRLHHESIGAGDDVTLYGYSVADDKSVSQISTRCEVMHPPQEVIDQKCPRGADDAPLCNFFAHQCDATSISSGSPMLKVTDEEVRIVGIYTGGSRIKDKATGQEDLYRWAVTTNPTTPESADVFFHWWNALNYELVDVGVRRNLSVAVANGIRDWNSEKGKAVETQVSSTLSNWPRLSFGERVRSLQYFDTWQSQWALYRSLRSLDNQPVDRNAALNFSFFEKVEIHRGDKNYQASY